MSRGEGISVREFESHIELQTNTTCLRITDSLEMSTPSSATPTAQHNVAAVIGLIRLITKEVLVTVSECTPIGRVRGTDIWQITKVGFISLSLPHTNPASVRTLQEKDDKQYLQLLSGALSEPHFYFSKTADITRTLQSRHTRGGSGDERFCANRFLAAPFRALKQGELFVVDVILGHVAVGTCTTATGSAFDYLLIARRDCARTGTRYNQRGLNDNGNAANCVEIEQIVVSVKGVSSYVQVRASAPLVWCQIPDFSAKPEICVGESSAWTRHFSTLHSHYGTIHSVDLLNQGGPEKPLGDAYRQAFAQSESSMPFIKYHSFDFHKHCRHSLAKIGILMEPIEAVLSTQGFFLQTDDKPTALKTQTAVFRTNCLDCLDRTTVVQSLIARKALDLQLAALGLPSLAECSDEGVFYSAWTALADTISLQYAGTPALKTDQSRAGTRTFSGKLKDTKASMTRYYMNHFRDGSRQDGYSLLVGAYRVSPQERLTVKSPLSSRAPMHARLLPVFFGVCLFFLLLTALTSSSRKLEYLAFWSAATLWIALTLRANVVSLVNKPQLS
eukprot:m.216129 g.216129  ORF g.216129 m.216129 type:complete len:560 (-) comp54097_c0_seq1:181-1860(-)